MEHIKRHVRYWQTYFPQAQDWRFRLQQAYRRWAGHYAERDFGALRLLDIPTDALFLDIGANRGDALQDMLLACPGRRIVAFEPNPVVFGKLQAAFGHLPDITFHNMGLGAENAVLEFNIPYYNGYMFDGLASFDYAEAANWLRTRMAHYREDLLRIKTLRCPIRRLDDFELAPAFVKIDVQGFELAVLQGGEQTLRQHRPILLIETPQPPETQFLEALGYRPHRYAAGRLEAGHGTLNTFFVPR